MSLKKFAVGGVCSVAVIIGVVLSEYSDQIRTGQTGLEIIGNAEGCRRDPYRCPADVLTVGIGSTEFGGEKIDPNKRYSDKEIADRWARDIMTAEQCVNRFANGEKLPQGAFEALTSLTFNVGCGKLKTSTIYHYAKQGDIRAMCEQFPRWKYSGGKILKGLVTRREKERALCLSDLKVR
ncbi:lysozyme [Rodentibacter haemolyticus]|uniref:Lysozyme n=1 Tax=Rodentibacter haemolyticus TaxID=2778911 RepID=A0ABX6UXM4_9PAST|nr:lysozyme [Rodentibacter haemolyticus]QPB42209.1 lysozyme [Rodentibacter haemolyticus]